MLTFIGLNHEEIWNEIKTEIYWGTRIPSSIETLPTPALPPVPPTVILELLPLLLF